MEAATERRSDEATKGWVGRGARNEAAQQPSFPSSLSRFVASSLLILLAGCASRTPPTVIQVLGEVPDIGPVSHDAFHPTAPGTWTYRVSEAADEHKVIEITCAATDHYGATIVEHEGPARSTFRRIDAEGNLVTMAVIDRRDAALTLFDPPLVVAPPFIGSGHEETRVSSMLVLDLDDPTRTKESGTATETLRYAGDYRIRVSGREYHARRIDSTFKADLKMADAETTTTYWVVQGMGPVAIERAEVVRTFGIPIRNRRQTWVLISAPGFGEVEPPG